MFEIPNSLIERFDADCRRAGIPKRDADGYTVDVHSLRMTFATMLSRSGVAPRVAMELLRHSRMELTMKTYTDEPLLGVQEALDLLPTLSLTPIRAENLPFCGGTEGQKMAIPGHKSSLAGEMPGGSIEREKIDVSLVPKVLRQSSS